MNKRFSRLLSYNRPENRMLLFIIMTVLLVTTGCASKTARIEQFSDFAEAGIAYQKAFDALLDFSMDNKVEADNRILLLNRELTSERNSRIEALSLTDKEFRDRQAVTNQVKKQGRYLKNYFVGLALLADGGPKANDKNLSTGIVDSTTTLAKTLSEISDDVAELRFGERNAPEAIGLLAPLAIANFQAKELDNALSQTAPAVQRALRIHRNVLESLENQLSDNEQLGHEQIRTETIFKPYINEGALPADWGTNRLNWFKHQLVIEQLSHASDAATQLELAFTALVERKSPGASFDLLLADITQLLDLVENFKSDTETSQKESNTGIAEESK